MYVRPCYRNRNGKRHAYWALVESYRTARGPRQRVVAYLGQLDQAGRLGVAHAAQDRAEPGQAPLFDETEPEWVEVDAARVRVERCREFGAPWLGMELMRQLDLPAFFDRAMPRGRERVRWSIMAQALVLARLCHPSSELHIAEHFYESSALPELLGAPARRVNDDRLYRALDQLLPHKAELQVHLKLRLGHETFILCRSADRRAKEGAMHDRFEKRIEDGLRHMAAYCEKKNYKPAVIERRVGKLLGRNSRAAGLFEVHVSERPDGGARVEWSKRAAWRKWAELSEGCYLLRSNVSEWTGAELWEAYMQLTEAEAAFRIHKSDLRIRPIWHQREDRVHAHILVCFLAYVLWKTLGQLCRRAHLGDEPRRVLSEIAQIRMVDVVLPTRQGIEIRKRCETRPTDHQAILLDRLGLRLPRGVKLTEM